MEQKTVLVIGTGTIGEPLIGLLSRLKNDLGIDRVIFHKRTPLDYEIAKVNSLVSQGAELSVEINKRQAFESLGHFSHWGLGEALREADVVIDCTPAGNDNKEKYYKKLELQSPKDRVFIAQGSEKGFGVPYAWGVNDKVLSRGGNNFVQVVSCNTHTISRIILAATAGDTSVLSDSDFVCIRRASDASQDEGFVPSPTVGGHSSSEFGTHHARDVSDLFQTRKDKNISIFSSAMKVNSQYMHMVRFSILLDEKLTREDVVKRFQNDIFVTTTHHKSANRVFSFGRDHGFYGRIYNQAVVCLPSLLISRFRGLTKVTGFALTPQDGNSLLSSVSACMYGLHGNDYLDRLEPIKRFLIDEV